MTRALMVTCMDVLEGKPAENEDPTGVRILNHSSFI